MHPFYLSLTLVVLGVAVTNCEEQSLTLASAKKTDYTIVVPDNTSAVTQTAANQLQKYLIQSTKAPFQIVKEGAYFSDKPAILVGKTKKTLHYMRGFDWSKLGREGTLIKTAGEDLMLAGGEPRGTLYAVVSFLEDYLGVRWWTALEEDVPSHKTFTLKPLDKVFVPKFPIRHNWTLDLQGIQPYAGSVTPEQSNLFCVHMKNNGKTNLPEALGGCNTIYSCHTVPLEFLPENQYFKEHPDWYGLVKGQRMAHQVCWMNKEMRKQLIVNVLGFLNEHPEVTVVSVSQNDGGNPCECPDCAAKVELEGTQMGPILDGVNEVAETVYKEFPQVMVETLSYYYSRKCPRLMKAHDNVLVRVCTYEQTVNKPLVESDYNLDNRTNLLEWGSHANNIFVWNYVTDFAHYMYPMPNLYNLNNNLQFFLEHNVKGVFMQGDIHCQTGDFQQLRAWLVSHLLWDPYQDDKKLIKEFCAGYYGPAGNSIDRWIRIMCEAGYKYPGFIGIYNGDLSFLNLETMNEGIQLWDRAQLAVANDAEKALRVKKARLSFDLACIVSKQRLLDEAKAQGKSYNGPTQEDKMVTDFLGAVKSFGTTHVSEVGGEMPLFESQLRSSFISTGSSQLEK